MEKEKLDAIRKHVNNFKDTLTGHWTETEKQMLHDILEGYEKLEKEIKNDEKLMDKEKALDILEKLLADSWGDSVFDDPNLKTNLNGEEQQALDFVIKLIKNGV